MLMKMLKTMKVHLNDDGDDVDAGIDFDTFEDDCEDTRAL